MGQRGSLGGLSTTLVVLCAGGMHNILLLLLVPCFFALGSSEVAVEFLVFLYFVVHNLPQLGMHKAIFSPI